MKIQGRFLGYYLLVCIVVILLMACRNEPWNNPYPSADENANIYYASFTEQPKTLDPARAYSSDEALLIGQIYEPPLQYHYLKRPYTLIPLTVTQIPQPISLDKNRKPLPTTSPNKNIAYSVYNIHIQPGIYYQPHPAFARKTNGDYYYHNLKKQDLASIHTIADFQHTGTRELTAEDYVYEIKRLADPQVQSPIFGFLSQYILGFSEYSTMLKQVRAKQNLSDFLDLRKFPLAGAEVIDKYTYRIILNGIYPQFLYWLAMPFFAPIPWEADYFYSQPGMSEKNITLDWYPVGTGPYMLEENNPNRVIVLVNNPNFHKEFYPSEGETLDQESGLLAMAGKPLPFIKKFIFTLEKETIPRWNKFLQGYYDQSAISSDSFEQAVTIGPNGQPEVTPALQIKDIRLQTSVSASSFYLGFNMLDPVVGGYDERANKLRQAIAIALDYEEFIAIFLNERAIPAHGPIPPGIFGYRAGVAGINPYVYVVVNNQVRRKSVDEAKRLLAEAGYPGGRDPKTGKPLLLHFDATSGATADDKAVFAWMYKQFAKLGIQLEIRATQYNRFQEKVRTGQEQIFFWGWSADYPDPENFLFLLYSPNGKVQYGGENATNYSNKEYDMLFEQMRHMPNGPERQTVIDRMLEIVQWDSPWVWGFHPQIFVLSHNWIKTTKPNLMANNTLKYLSIDSAQRAQKRNEWNQPILWPIGIGLLLLVIGIASIVFYYWRKQHEPMKKNGN